MSKKRKHGEYPHKYEKDKLAKFESKKRQKHPKHSNGNSCDDNYENSMR